jgi:hypothetical protein
MERIRQTNETRIFVSFLNIKLATKINNIIVNKERSKVSFSLGKFYI